MNSSIYTNKKATYSLNKKQMWVDINALSIAKTRFGC